MSVDSPPTNEARNRRRPLIAAAAIVAVIAVAAIATNSPSDDDGGRSPAVAPTAASITDTPTTVTPTTVAPRFETGFFGGYDGVRVGFDVPDTWGVFRDWPFGAWLVHRSREAGPDEAGVSFWDVGNIYAEGCQWVPADPPVGPTVDDLVSAFANLPGLAPTAAVDITIDGYLGKKIEFTVPNFTGCRSDFFALWQQHGNVAQPAGSDEDLWWPHNAIFPNAHVQLWILDVGGTRPRLVIAAYSYPDTSPQDRAALDELLASIELEAPRDRSL